MGGRNIGSVDQGSMGKTYNHLQISLMIVKVRVTKSFTKNAKPLLKKFPSLRGELLELEKKLIDDPGYGIPLGKNIFKIKLAVTSKKRGKSGGLRVISYLETIVIGIIEKQEKEIKTVNLIAIFDKSETETITDKEIKELISRIDI